MRFTAEPRGAKCIRNLNTLTDEWDVGNFDAIHPVIVVASGRLGVAPMMYTYTDL